ncbi:hypothetical protein AFEL58S_00139 [Afipia felis]
MLADALGRPLRFIVTAGQVGDITQAPALLDGQTGRAVLADKAYDSNALRAIIAASGATALNAASAGSNTSAASPLDTTGEQNTSPASSSSQQP